MLAAVTLVRNPFYPERDREVRPVLSPASVRGWLIQQGIEEFDRPTICLFNGQAVLRADWENTFINDNDVVAFVTLPQGGGGGGGGGPSLSARRFACSQAHSLVDHCPSRHHRGVDRPDGGCGHKT